MHSLIDKNIMREIILDHYSHPRNRGLVKQIGYKSVNMNSETCIDNIDIEAKFNGDKIENIHFDGEACAISTSSTDIMTELLQGKTLDEALNIIENYTNMIYGKDYDPEVLDEAIAFSNTYKQANRIKCATIGWNGIKELIEKEKAHG